MTYFEDLRVGTRAEVGSHTFTADEIKAFAREFDPQPFHLDEKAAARSHFGALCASGWARARKSAPPRAPRRQSQHAPASPTRSPFTSTRPPPRPPNSPPSAPRPGTRPT